MEFFHDYDNPLFSAKWKPFFAARGSSRWTIKVARCASRRIDDWAFILPIETAG